MGLQNALRRMKGKLFSSRQVRLVFAAAVAGRLLFMVFFPVSITGSGRRYVDPATAFIAGRWGATETIDQLPGAPLFFVPFFILFGERYLPVVLGQHLLGLVTLYLLMSLAKRAWGERAAVWAGALIAAQLIIPYQECFLLSETVGQFWSSAALFLTVSLRENASASPRRWVLGGAAAAMAALSRGEYLFLGPLAALMLALPGKESRRAVWRGAALYLGGWALLVGGWTLRNSLLGFPGFNPHGPTVLLDTALPLVRWDLPTEPLAKRVLKEQRDICEIKHCDPRPTALYRLEHEYGFSFLETRKMIGHIAREAVLTQPEKFLPMVWRNFLTFFAPRPWVSDERLDQRTPIMDTVGRNKARAAFWEWMEAGPQYAGWAPLALACFSPIALLLAPGRRRWAAALLLAGAVCVAATASLFRAVARTQADLYLPLSLLGAFSADSAWRSRKG